MLELALLTVLVGSVCFLAYEFFKIYQAYQERMHYYRFLPALNMSEMSKELDRSTTNSESKIKLNNIDYAIRDIRARMERQEAVIEKLIKGLSD
jgi:hypothetical protein